MHPNLNQRGFTLIEVMIAVVIIGILASVGVPAYSQYRDRSIVADAYSLMHEVRLEITEAYVWDRTLPTEQVSYKDRIPSDMPVRDFWWFSKNGDPRIVIEFSNAAGEALSRRRLWLQLNNSEAGVLKWTCTTHPTTSWAIDNDRLPAACR